MFEEPLTASDLASAPNAEQKQMLGERLFPLIQQTHPEQAGKITGMLLEMDNSLLLHLLEDVNTLNAKTREAAQVLEDHLRQCTTKTNFFTYNSNCALPSQNTYQALMDGIDGRVASKVTTLFWCASW